MPLLLSFVRSALPSVLRSCIDLLIVSLTVCVLDYALGWLGVCLPVRSFVGLFVFVLNDLGPI